MPRLLPYTLLLLLLVLGSAGPAMAQDQGAKPTLDPAWMDSFPWRCVGPAVMGGRITAMSVYENDPSIFYVSSASGGLLKTTNNGMTFEHLFDHQATVSIGAVCVYQGDSNIVWVGTGEANPRNSVSYGDGVYKSTDGGKTFANVGLKNAFQIGRIVIHPENPDIVYVGALGRLYGPSDERGLYKTTDGGESWERILFVDDKTGVIDVAMHPTDPETLLVATYERQRDGFDSNSPAKKIAPGSGLWRTTDGGKTFEKVTAGLPSCNLGRIGIDYSRQNPENVFIVLESEKIGQLPENAAYVGFSGENAETGAKVTKLVEDGPGAKAGLEKGDIILEVDGVLCLSWNAFIEEVRKHDAGDTVKLKVARKGKALEIELALDKQPEPEAEEKEDQQPSRRRSSSRSPFSSGLGGQRENVQGQQGKYGHEHGGVYKSSDGGLSWTRINSLNPRPMYFSRLAVDPSDENYLYVCGISFYSSADGGETFSSNAGGDTHPDHHALWVDPRDGRHLLLGNDGGLYVTYDRCKTWAHLDNAAIGQFYHCEIGPRRDYWVYGGLQDNGSWGAPARGIDGNGAANHDWVSVGGGDGFVVKVDPNDPNIVYSESQGGMIGRVNLKTGERGRVRPPRPEKGTRYRFNWNTPFVLSHHNSGIFYTAGNFVFRSLWRGDDVRRISPEITLTDRGSATALAESPLDPDVLYVGTDDGALWMTRNGGHDWIDLAPWPKEEENQDEASEKSDETGAAGRDPAGAMRPHGPSAAAEPAAAPGAQEGEQGEAAPPVKDDVTGEWEGEVITDFDIGGAGTFTMSLELVKGKVRGTLHSDMGDSDVTGGSYDPKTGEIEFTTESDQGEATIKGTIKGGKLTGEIVFMDGEFSMDIEAKRSGSPSQTGESPAATSAQDQESAASEEQGESPHVEQVEVGEKSLVSLVPGPRWVSSIKASRYKAGRVYLCLDGHRSDDDSPYLFVSEDYGKTWTSITGNLPWGSSRVIEEDRVNENLLYAGTEFGAWVSVNRGKDWSRFGKSLPTVAVHDFAQHRTCGDIVAATHGRSLWIIDATPLRQITEEVLQAKAHLFTPAPAIKWGYRPRRGGWGRGPEYRGATPPSGAEIYYLLGEKAREVTLEVKDLEGNSLRTLETSTDAGMHRVSWDLRRPRPRGSSSRRYRYGGGMSVADGKYILELTVDGVSYKTYLQVEPAPADD